MKSIKKNKYRKYRFIKIHFKKKKHTIKNSKKGGARLLVEDENESKKHNHSAAITIGRFSGTHKGHSKLIQQVNEIAKKNNAIPFIFVTGYGKSKTTNKDPLLHHQKIDFLRKLNPKFKDSIMKTENYPEINPIKTIFSAINYLYDERGISDITVILGEDRKPFADRIKNYFHQHSDINISIGPLKTRTKIKQDELEFEVSGNNIRKFAREGNTKSLKSLLPNKTSLKVIRELTQAIIEGTPSSVKKTKKKKRLLSKQP